MDRVREGINGMVASLTLMLMKRTICCRLKAYPLLGIVLESELREISLGYEACRAKYLIYKTFAGPWLDSLG